MSIFLVCILKIFRLLETLERPINSISDCDRSFELKHLLLLMVQGLPELVRGPKILVWLPVNNIKVDF